MPAFDRLHGAYGPGSVVRRYNRGSRYEPARESDARDDDRIRAIAPMTGRALLDRLLEPEIFDELVDRVAERIEQRVIDELERRGERGVPGVF